MKAYLRYARRIFNESVKKSRKANGFKNQWQKSQKQNTRDYLPRDYIRCR